MTPKVLAFCPDYNGRPAHFMMRADDDRLDGARYVKIADARVTPTFVDDPVTRRRARVLSAAGRLYYVFSDWSVRMEAL